MPSSGSKQVGLAEAKLGPFRCGNCQKFQEDVCYDDGVAKDSTIPGYKDRTLTNGHIRVEDNECCNEFLSLSDKQKWDGKLPKARKDASDGIGHMILMGKRPPAK